MKICLKKGCHLVEGAKNAAIYDLNNKKIYSINSKSKILLKEVINKDIEKLNGTQKEYIQELSKLDLICYDNYVKQENIKIELPIKLNFAWLELTDRCNLDCVHCYGEFGHPAVKNASKMKFTDWKKVIDKLSEIKCNAIQFIGGEPLIYKDFIKLLEYAYKKNINNITVFTNATLLDEYLVKIFKKYNINVRVSLYGHNSETHEKITGKKGSFEKTKNALILLKKYNVNTSIAIVIMKENESFLK